MHECPHCYAACHCKGDIDDINFGEVDWCEHWQICDNDNDNDEYRDYWNGEPDPHDPEV